MIYRTDRTQIDAYYRNEGLNRGMIKTILSRGMQAALAEQRELIHSDEEAYLEKEHFILGQGVDCLITEGEESFNQRYYHSTLTKKPGDVQMSIVKMVYAKVKEEIREDIEIWGDSLPEEKLKSFSNRFTDYAGEIYDAMNTVKTIESGKEKIGYYMNRCKPFEDDQRHVTLLKDGLCQAYWEDLLKADGKQVLSDDQYNCINNMYMSLTTHPFTRSVFLDTPANDVDIVYQYPLYWEEDVAEDGDTITCKVLPDLFKAVHSRKLILPLDIKTLSDYSTNFPKQMKVRRYDIQGSFYKRGVEKNLRNISRLLNRDVTDYTIPGFGFIVESTYTTGTPLKFIMEEELLRVGEYGDGDQLRGWRQALDIYRYWRKKEFSLEQVVGHVSGALYIGNQFEIKNGLML